MESRLIRLSETMGLCVTHENLHRRHPGLDGYARPARGLIFLDHSIRGTRQGICVLSEEVGHCLYPPAADHLTYHSREFWQLSQAQRDNLSIMATKDERAALLWATEYVIPDWKFWAFYSRGPHNWWHWLEHFEVEDWFMRTKVGFMRCKHPFKWREMVTRTS